MDVITQYKSPLEMLYQWEARMPDKIYLREPVNGIEKTFTWKETAHEARLMAAYLVSLNLPPESKIALLSKNCAHWIICDLAIMMSGHISVPLYPNLSSESINYILTHCEARVLFIGKLDEWQRMKEGVPPELKCISFPFYPHDGVDDWIEILKNQNPMATNVDRDQNEDGTIIYTSGTTGLPKGVVHSFNSFSFTTQNAVPFLGFNTASRFFSYLPLSHSAERSLVEMGSLYSGGTVYFAESIPRFAKNLAEAKPTEFLAVHHIWKKFQHRILEKIPQKRLSILLKLPFMSSWIKMKIKRELGLQYAKNILTGASPTPVALMEWFATIGIIIQDAYGMTENWSYSHINRKGHIKLGFVGQAFPGVETKITNDGEILVKHDGIMKNYFKEVEKTNDAFSGEGFLRTGDAGFLDEDGYLKITGRMKDLLKTSKGNYVSPAPIEAKLSGNENIDFVCIVGNDMPQPMALVVLSGMGKAKTKDQLLHDFEILLTEMNQSLDRVEQITRLILLYDVWSVENGILTPTFKVKRREVEKLYEDRFERWQELAERVIFQSPRIP